jgi:hypothetical protein
MQDGPRFLTSEDLNNTTTTQGESLGAVGVTGDGRGFRYVGYGYVNGTTTFNPGLLMIAPVAPAASTALAITASGTGGQSAANLKAGSTSLVITNGATAVWQDEFKEGYLVLNIGGSGAGVYNLKIMGNTAAAGSGYITLLLQDPIPLNATTLVPGTDTASLRINPFSFVIPSLTENKAVGVSQTTSTAATAAASATVGPGSYGWVQTSGPATVSATSGTLGYPVGQDVSTTAGFVINKSSGTTTEELGTFITAAANGLAYVNLHII